MTMIPVSRERHAPLRWRRRTNFSFAAQRGVIPLVAAELANAAPAFPVAFTKQSPGFLPVAVVGIEPNVNLFVSPDGAWHGRYVPAELRAYPFGLMPAEDGRQVLCVDEDPACVGPGPEGEPFFTPDGKPSEPLAQVVEFLRKVEQNRGVTSTACRALEASGCIEPWPITIRFASGERRLEGLFRVNEDAFNSLSDEALIAVRRAGGLPIAYVQLFSLQQLPLLGEMAAARAQRAPQVQLGRDLDLSWLNSDILKLGSAGHTPPSQPTKTGDNKA